MWRQVSRRPAAGWDIQEHPDGRPGGDASAAAGIKPPALGEAQPAPSAPAPRPTACSQTAQPWWRRSVPPWPSTPGRAARRLPIRVAPRTCPGGGSTSHCGPPTSPRLPEQGVTWRQMRPLTPSASNTSATPPHGAGERCAHGGPSRCLHQGLTRPSYCPPWCRCPPAPRDFIPLNGFVASPTGRSVGSALYVQTYSRARPCTSIISEK